MKNLILEDFILPFSLTTEEIKKQTKQEGKDFVQMQLIVNEDELRATKEIADEEKKNY